jgi:hypothetical protein
MIAAAAIAIAFWIEPCQRPAEMACFADDAELAGWALDAWARASEGRVAFRRVAVEKEADFRFYWAGVREGLYGEARPVRVNGRRGAEIYLRPPAAGAGDRLYRDVVLYLTCLHESGHALGLGHTADFDDIMYSFQHGGDLREYFDRWRRKLAGRSGLRTMGGYSPADSKRLQRSLEYWNAF